MLNTVQPPRVQHDATVIITPGGRAANFVAQPEGTSNSCASRMQIGNLLDMHCTSSGICPTQQLRPASEVNAHRHVQKCKPTLATSKPANAESKAGQKGCWRADTRHGPCSTPVLLSTRNGSSRQILATLRILPQYPTTSYGKLKQCIAGVMAKHTCTCC